MNKKIIDFIIGIKNASLARRRSITIPYSNMNKVIGKILVKENFLEDLTSESQDGKKVLTAKIRYEKRKPVLKGVSIISKPSLRTYIKGKNITQKKGFGLLIISTNGGVMTEREAKKRGLGGEVLFRVW